MRKSSWLAIALSLFAVSECWAQGAPLPWGQSSDQVAWEIYAQIMAAFRHSWKQECRI